MKLFPVQKSQQYGKPHPLLIPWDVAELAYSQYHYSQTLERIAERGGFGPGEMDEYCPDWIERCDRIVKLEAEILRLRKCANCGHMDYFECGECQTVVLYDGEEILGEEK